MPAEIRRVRVICHCERVIRVSNIIQQLTFAEDNNPVVAISGPAALAEAYSIFERWGTNRILIICGRTVSQLASVTDFIDEAPAGMEFSVFSDVEPDPSDTTCANGGQAAREFRAQAVIGIGGGSSMDAAKAIAAEAIQPGWTVAQDHPDQPTEVNFEPLPIVLCPTTAGTASEVTPFSVITYTQTNRKLVLNHEKLYAKYALLDPKMISTCSREVRVAAGMDALTHAIESCVSKNATEQTRRRAYEAIAIIAPNLPRVAANENDTEAQQQMQLGAMIAGLAFSKSRLGIVHAMALPLSALFHIPHGVANAVLLPHGMRFNTEAATEGYAAAATALGIDTNLMTPEEAAISAVENVARLAANIGAPQHMSELGVSRDAIPQMAEDAMPSAHVAVNPRQISIQDIINVYNNAY